MSTYYAKGQWNVICDRCGFEYKSGQVKKEWTGNYVCRECWETRHPQDFVRGVKDDPSVAFTRPDQTGTETDTSSWSTPTSKPSGTFNNEI